MCLVTPSCLTLYNCIGCSPPGSSVHGTFQGRILEWLPFSSPEKLPDPGIALTSPVSPALQAYSLPSETSGKPKLIGI